jgi:flagellar basal body rod protein FlgG
MSLSKSVDLLAGAMSARARAQEIHANNLANVTTDGFLRQRVAFAQQLADAQDRIEVVSRLDRAAAPAYATGRLADVAMRDESFLVVNTPAGERYMRGGSLILNDAGQIADRHGYPVLGVGGPISPGTAEFQLTERGEVLAEGEVAGRLRVVKFPPAAQLAPAGGGLFTSDLPAQQIELPDLVPGHRQSSNVQVIGEMVTMVESSRLYEASAKALRTYDETMGRLVQTTQQAIR